MSIRLPCKYVFQAIIVAIVDTGEALEDLPDVNLLGNRLELRQEITDRMLAEYLPVKKREMNSTCEK